MYRPIIELLSDFKSGFKKHILKVAVFAVGAGIGFVGLSGVAGYLLEANAPIVTCVFIGFILGTFPSLWRDAGEQGRKPCVMPMAIGFAIMLGILLTVRNLSAIEIKPDVFGFLLCGVMWGLSFIVPGLSSSTLLLFFGLYQPMLSGIAEFDFYVLIPMAIGMGLSVILLSKGVNFLYKKYFAAVSHAVIGIVAATTLLIFPDFGILKENIPVYLISITGGAAVSFALTVICERLDKKVAAEV